MTPKEKADQLLTRYINQWFAFGDYLSLAKAKQCALIAVDEILEDNRISYMLLGVGINKYYWEEVKKEIEAL
jgi:hypothetical protein